MLMLLFALTGCATVLGDKAACSDGEDQGFADGLNDGLAACGYDDSVDPEIIVDWPSAYESGSFTACYKEGYEDGFNQGELEAQNNTTPAECD